MSILYPLHYKVAFAFSSILYPLSFGLPLRSACSECSRRDSSGLPCFDCMTIGQRGLHLCSGGNFDTLLLAGEDQLPLHIPFGYGDSALLHHSSDYETYDDSLTLILLIFSLVVCRLRLPASNRSCPAYANFIAYFCRGRSR